MAQYPAIIDLDDLDGANGYRFATNRTNNQFGTSVGNAGDFNGDGYADIAVGAPDGDPHGQDSGRTYLVFGRPADGLPSLSTAELDGLNGFEAEGAQPGRSGSSVTSAGDLNGDGLDDLAIGAPNTHPGLSLGGRTYILFGSREPVAPVFDLRDLDGDNGFRINGETSGSLTGGSLAPAGDVNGDGVDDLIIGGQKGAYVVFGNRAGFDADLSLAALDGANGFEIQQEADVNRTGASVSSAGDINGDGFDDLLVGAPGSTRIVSDPYGYYTHTITWPGKAYVIFGKGVFGAAVSTADLAAEDGFTMDTASLTDEEGLGLGNPVASAGDVNGDGFDDILVDGTGGRAYVVFGKDGGFGEGFDLNTMDASTGFRVVGATSVASAGDVNGDGFDDMVFGLSVLFGKASGFGAQVDLAGLNGANGFKIEGGANLLHAKSAGDVNRDGLDDLIVASDQNPGVSYIVYGRLPEGPLQRIGTDAGQSLVGSTQRDTMDGRDGDDRIFGHDRADRLYGGEGNDTLVGGRGADRMRGDGGKDIFEYEGIAASRPGDADIIAALRFNDRIDLRGIDANANRGGDQAFKVVDSFTGAADLVVRYHTSGEFSGFTTIEGHVNADGVADLLILVQGDVHSFDGFLR